MICDTPNPVSNFDGARYMGTWYTASHSRGMPFQLDRWSCTTAMYGDLEADGAFKLYNSSETKYHVGPRFGVHGTAVTTSDAGSVAVSIGAHSDAPNYFVVDTDYENYSIVYNCSQKYTNITELWYLTRNPVATQAELEKYERIARAALPNFNFDLMLVDQQGAKCRYATSPYLTL